MSNKGYYSWIHTLKSAAMDSRNKGIEMINEQRAQRASGASRANLQAQLDAPPPPPPTRKLDVAGKGYGGKDEEIINIPGEGPRTRSHVERAFAEVISDKLRENPSERASIDSVELADGDPVAFAQIQSMQDAQRSAELAQARGPVDAKPAGDANAVARDGKDGVMADDEFADSEPFSLPSYSLAADARAETARMNYKNASRQRRIDARTAGTEEDYEASQEAGLDLPTANWRTVKESVSDKINRFFGA